MATSMPKKLSMRSNGRILGRTSEAQKGWFLRQLRNLTAGKNLKFGIIQHGTT
jgi:hypothetical protein